MVDATTASLALRVSYSAPTLPFQVEVPVEHVAEVLVEFDGRRRAFLVALLNGYSKRAAAASVGVTARTVQLWAKKDDLFAEAVRYCEDIGFTAVIETELYRRAVAGTADRSSMRALELVLKSRDSRYREKGAGEGFAVRQRSEEAVHRTTQGWDSHTFAPISGTSSLRRED